MTRPLTEYQIATLLRVRRGGASVAAAANAAGMAEVTAYKYLRSHPELLGRRAQGATIEERVPDSVLADREHRRGLAPRDLTASLCGDPLPGYSALDAQR